MSSRTPFLPGLFIATGLALVGVLGWMTLRLIKQDHALVEQGLQQRLENAADNLVASIDVELAQTEQRLVELANMPDSSITLEAGSYATTLAEGIAITVADDQSIEMYPANTLQYYPVIPPQTEPDPVLYAAAEKFEFQRKEFASAIAQYRQLAREHPTARAGALIRLARVLRKLGQLHDALDVYTELGDFPNAYVDGLPVDLLACYGRCLVLEKLQQTDELEREASALRSTLRLGRWKLTRADYRFYEQATMRWVRKDSISDDVVDTTDEQRLALTAGAELLWSQWQQIQRGEVSKQGRQVRWVRDVPLLLIWHATEKRQVALVATAASLMPKRLDVVLSLFPPQSLRINLIDYQGRAVLGRPARMDEASVVRTSTQTNLPYTLEVTIADRSAAVGESAGRRRLLLAGLGTTLLVVLVASYFVLRSVARELKVARLQSNFVSAVSHEFRTPLASIYQLSELLADGRVSGEERRGVYYQALQRESRRLQRLVESLLDFGRMEAGAREYDFRDLDLVTFVREVGEEFEMEVRDRGYAVEIEVEDLAPKVVADREALRLAVWNLLDNAVKYSPECHTVSLDVGCDERHVFIRVRDHGIGIRPRHQREIFEKFFRSPEAVVTGVKGTGLGLAIVKKIVAAHGATLEVDSTPQEGSTFSILFRPVGTDSQLSPSALPSSGQEALDQT